MNIFNQNEKFEKGLKGGDASFFSKEYTTTQDIAVGELAQERFIAEGEEYANGPFDTMLITNLGTAVLGIRLDHNPKNRIPVGAGNTYVLEKMNYRNFTIENMDASNVHTAGTIKILVGNSKTSRRI